MGKINDTDYQEYSKPQVPEEDVANEGNVEQK